MADSDAKTEGGETKNLTKDQKDETKAQGKEAVKVTTETKNTKDDQTKDNQTKDKTSTDSAKTKTSDDAKTNEDKGKTSDSKPSVNDAKPDDSSKDGTDHKKDAQLVNKTETSKKKDDKSNKNEKKNGNKGTNNNNKGNTEGGKAKAGSASNQGKTNQGGEQKMSYKEKRRQKDQERYQRKVQKAENRAKEENTPKSKEDSAQKSKTEKGKGDKDVKEDNKKEKTVVETKGKSVIEAPETKQGGDAMTEDEIKLEEHQIFRLAKKSLRFPKAKFYCRICNYHLDTPELAFKHCDESRHSKLEKTKKDQEFLRTLPPASDAHHEALTNLLNQVVAKRKLTKQDMDKRAEIAPRLEAVLKKELPKCKVHLYGSSSSGFGFKDSNVNLDIQMPPEVTPATILTSTDKAMHKHSGDVFTEVVTDFEGKFPCINFKDKKTGLTCQVGTSSQCAVDTAKLLKEYYKLDERVPVLCLAFRYLAQLCKIDQQADGSMPSYAFVLMVIHFLQQCQPSVLPVIQEKETLKEKNTKTIGELWIDLLKFYVVEIPIEENVISIRNRKPNNRQDMKIPNKRLAVEDPFAINKKNISKSLTTSVVFQYIMERLREALKYFGLPRYQPGKEPTPSNCYSYFVHTKSPTGVADKKSNNSSKTVDDLAKDMSNKLVLEHADSHRTCNKGHQEQTASKTGAKLAPNSRTAQSGVIDGQVHVPSVSDFNFVFEKDIITGGEEVPLVCSGCGVEGHSEKDCQDEALIDLIPLPPMPGNFMRKIDILCMNICEEVQVARWDIEMRDQIIWELQGHIRRNGFPETNLRLFGSSMNGFGFHQSDLDICMTFKNVHDPSNLNYPEIIEKLAKILKKNRNLYGIFPIPTAKVPIVKFIHRPSRLEGDISLYNLLAQANTKMLYCYSSIDQRVRQLVYTMKLFAKMCDIGDASKGSLSSYAFTLMTLFFLQQRKPPIIPVLQELPHGKEKPKQMLEGWNAWFYEDMRTLPRVWKELGKNHESVGQLWLGMLRFYTEDFDFKKHVITIRQLKPLTRFEKMWTAPSRGFAIEDPFDLDHNLGGGVSRKMATYMMQVLRKTRERFGLPRRIPPYTEDFLMTRFHGANINSQWRPWSKFSRQSGPWSHWDNLRDMDFFFDVEFLSDGKAPPNDRGCRVCGKIGHFVKDCPRKRPKSESNDKRDGSPTKQARDGSPKKTPQKDTPNKGASDNATTPNKESANKKAAPEKEILKRDQKPVDSKASPAVPSATKPGFQQRSATITPTTRPLTAPASSATSNSNTTATTSTSASSVNKVSDGGGAGKETTHGEKQRTNSIGDTWEHHKQTGKKVSKKKKKKSQDEGTPDQPSSQTPTSPTPPTTTTTTQSTQQKAPTTTTQSTTTTTATPSQSSTTQKTPAKSVPSSTQVTTTTSAPSAQPQRGILNVNHLSQAPGGYRSPGNQKGQQPGKGGFQPQQKGQQKMQQGSQQKGGYPQKNHQQHQKGPQGFQPRSPQPGILAAWLPPGLPHVPLPGTLPQQGGPHGAGPNQKPFQSTSPQKTPYNNNNQKFTPQQQQQQQRSEQQKTSQQPQKTPNQQQQQNQKGQQVGKNQKGQKNVQAKTTGKAGDPPIPTLAQPIGGHKHNPPFSKKRLPKAPNLSSEQQQDERKALLEMMGKGLGKMLQEDRDQRRALKQAEMHSQIQNVPQQMNSMGDNKPGYTGTGGAFHKYPTQPPPAIPQTSTASSGDGSPKKSPSATSVAPGAPGPARFQSSLPIGQHQEPFNKQPSPTDLGFPSQQYHSYENQQRSPSAIGRSQPKFPTQHSPGNIGGPVGQPRMTSPAVGGRSEITALASVFQPARFSAPKSEVSPPGATPITPSNRNVFHDGSQSPVEINQYQPPGRGREEPELPVFGSSPSKHALNLENSPPGFIGGGSTHHQQAPGEQTHQQHQQSAFHPMMGMSPYPGMEHLAYSQGNVPAESTKSSPRDFHYSMFQPQQGRSPEEVNPYSMMGNQPIPIGVGGMRRYNSEDSPQGFPDRQAPGNQHQSLPTSSPMGAAKFAGAGHFDISTWMQLSNLSPSSAASQTPMRYPQSNMAPFGNLNTSPGTPPFLNYSAPGGYASHPAQLGGMPPSPPSQQLHQSNAMFGGNTPSQIAPSPPDTRLFQSNLFGTPGVIGSPAGAPFTSSPASMHMMANEGNVGLGYGTSESSVVSQQNNAGERLYREAVTLSTTSSTYPAFPQGTASNAAVPTHINVHPKPTVLPYANATYAQHQLASMYNTQAAADGQQLVHGEVEGQGVIGQGQGVIGQSPR